MEIKFFFERDDDKRSVNFQNLVKHIDEYLKEHPDLELNKIEYCDPDGRNVYALVSFKENESMISTLKCMVQNLTAKVEEQRMKINDLECMLSHAKESLFSKNIINDVPDEVVDKMVDDMDKGLSAREVIDEAISSLDDGVYV